MDKWRMVTSSKPKHRGEAFLLRNDAFCIKVYANSVPNVNAFARWLADQLNGVDERAAKGGGQTPEATPQG